MTCCPPDNSRATEFSPTFFEPSLTADRPASVVVPGGLGLLGTSKPLIRTDGEGPLRKGRVRSVSMSQGSITNAQFAAFVAETGYITEAEHIGWSFVFWSQVPDYLAETWKVPGSPWWHRVDGVSWQRITGPECDLIEKIPDHPVVHVSWNDSTAYASWAGGRLPTELEWEHAARGGLGDVRYPWGDTEPDDKQTLLCNIWQGIFPRTNTALDGYETTAPAVSFGPNGFGLYNMVGNVWDWTADTFRVPSRLDRQGAIQSDAQNPMKLAKGGSFLCHKSYCHRYRIAARIANTVDSATTHMGFRVVWDD